MHQAIIHTDLWFLSYTMKALIADYPLRKWLDRKQFPNCVLSSTVSSWWDHRHIRLNWFKAAHITWYPCASIHSYVRLSKLLNNIYRITWGDKKTHTRSLQSSKQKQSQTKEFALLPLPVWLVACDRRVCWPVFALPPADDAQSCESASTTARRGNELRHIEPSVVTKDQPTQHALLSGTTEHYYQSWARRLAYENSPNLSNAHRQLLSSHSMHTELYNL